MSLSVAIAVHNEEKNIIRCLESVYDWVDEIVIVDGASTDNTVRVIKEFEKMSFRTAGEKSQNVVISSASPVISSASEKSHQKEISQSLRSFEMTKKSKIIIIKTSNKKMFHINKQKALDACTKDWILQLDADEIVSPELRQEILQVINPKSEILNPKQYQNSNDQNSKQNRLKNLAFENSDLFRASNFDIRILAYNIPRLNYFLGKPLRKGGQYPDYTIRLYRNGVAKFPCKDVHENVIITQNSNVKSQIHNSKLKTNKLISTDSNRLQPKIGFLNNPLLHFPYPTFTEYLNKWDRYCKLEAERLKQQGFKPSLINTLKYYFVYPKLWFLKTYFRHKGFMDGWPGFVFCLFSSLRYWKIYSYINKQ